MNEKLVNLIKEIKSIKGLNAYDEQSTKQIIIIRILNELGWNSYDINEIKPEYPVDLQNTSEKVDYALAQNTDNMVFIEAKAVNVDLSNYEEQICKYCFRNNVVLGVLTNGISWWFYLPTAKGNWYDRKFYSIDLIKQNEETISSEFINYLYKQNVLSGEAEDKAKKTHESGQKNDIIKKTLPLAWNDLINSEDEVFLDLFNSYIEKKCGFRVESQQILAEFMMKNSKYLLFPEQISQPIKKSVQEKIVQSTREKKSINYIRTGFTGMGITGFILNNKKYTVNSWKQLLMTVCKEIYNLNKEDFNKVLSLRGKKRPYFTRNFYELRRPEKIKNVNIYVETCLSANSIVSLCEDVLSLFGYKNLKIESNVNNMKIDSDSNSIAENKRAISSPIDQFFINKSKYEKIKTTFPDGTIIQDNIVKDTFVKTIIKIGAERIKLLGLRVGGAPLIHDSRIEKASPHQVSSNCYIATRASTKDKIKVLNEIKDRLSVNFEIEIL